MSQPRPPKACLRSLLCVTLLAVGNAGCASYVTNRGRDACDMVTATVGGGAAARVRIGPLALGPAAQSDVAGLRYGELFYHAVDWQKPDEVDNRPIVVASFAVTILIGPFLGAFGGDPFEPIGNAWEHAEYDWGKWESFAFSATQTLRGKHERGLTEAAAWRVEVCAGVGGTARVGINAAEILDFAAGLVGFDLLDDDIGRTEPDGE